MILRLIFVLVFVSPLFGQTDFDQMREIMVKEQIANRGISDGPTLRAMKTVPRHLFVPEGWKSSAYMDSPLPIGHKQTISQPYIVAYMTAQLNLKSKEKVLEIGTGSGYQAAVLAEIVDSVYTIEILEPLGLQAKKVLKELGYDNVEVKIGDGYNGWPEHAPFDAIMVTAGAEKIPDPLIEQLAEGGRMIIPVGRQGYVQSLQIIRKRKGKITIKDKLPVRFVPFTRDKDSL